MGLRFWKENWEIYKIRYIICLAGIVHMRWQGRSLRDIPERSEAGPCRHLGIEHLNRDVPGLKKKKKKKQEREEEGVPGLKKKGEAGQEASKQSDLNEEW